VGGAAPAKFWVGGGGGGVDAATLWLPYAPAHRPPRAVLVFTPDCHCQYCVVYGIHKRGWVSGCILPNSRAIVLQQCGQCRRAGRMKGRFIRAHD